MPYGHAKGDCFMRFKGVKAKQLKNGTFPYGPCKSEGEWEFLEWAVESGLSQHKLDKLLNLKIVSTSLL
jgi:hypothetical protein